MGLPRLKSSVRSRLTITLYQAAQMKRQNDAVREGGVDALLQRDKPGPREGEPRGLAPGVLEEMRQKLRDGQFDTAEQARRWLEETHGVARPYGTVWRWLKKRGECSWCRVQATPIKIPTRHRNFVKPSLIALRNL
jgi:transposase